MGLRRVPSHMLESSLGPYSARTWEDGVSVEDLQLAFGAVRLDVWTDGSLVRDEASGACCGGARVHSLAGSAWFRRSWRHLDLLRRVVGNRC